MKAKNVFATKEDNKSRFKKWWNSNLNLSTFYYCYIYFLQYSSMHKRIKNINSFLKMEYVCETSIHFRALQEYDDVKSKVSTNI